MARVKRALLASFFFLTVTTLVGYFTVYLKIAEFLTAFLIGLGISVLGILVGLLCKRLTCIPAFFINAVAMGFWLRAWYINRGFNNPLWMMLLVTLLATAYMVVFVLPLYIPAVNRHYGWYVGIFVVLSLGGYVALLVFTTTTWVSTLGFFGILQLSFILGLSFNTADWQDEQRALLASSYSILICGVIILAVALSGDGCDSCDCDCSCDGGISSPVKKNKDGSVTPSALASVQAAAKAAEEQDNL